MSDPFRFKQFQVFDSNSSMKVGTDAVLLGVYSMVESTNHILDIGTGCGIIALMLAQRSDSQILAIDIDQASIKQASDNFRCSVWSQRLKALQISVQELSELRPKSFDLIVSNPPFFSSGIKPENKKKLIARHTDTLSRKDLISSVTKLLSDEGVFDLILPVNEAQQFIAEASSNGLFLIRKRSVISIQGKEAKRMIMSFSKRNGPLSPIDETLTINTINSSVTDAFKALAKDFYLEFT